MQLLHHAVTYDQDFVYFVVGGRNGAIMAIYEIWFQDIIRKAYLNICDDFYTHDLKIFYEPGEIEYRVKMLRGEIWDALGVPGTDPPTQIIKFELLEADVDCFLEFMASIRKKNGGLVLKPGAHQAFRSSFTYLFHRYRYIPSRAFEKNIKEAMEAVKRYTNQAAQSGEGNIHVCKRTLSYGTCTANSTSGSMRWEMKMASLQLPSQS